MTNLNHVSQLSPATSSKQKAIAMIGVNGTPGARNPRWISGCLCLIHNTPADTRMKAVRVPMLTSSERIFRLMNPAVTAVMIPKNHVPCMVSGVVSQLLQKTSGIIRHVTLSK